MNTIICGALLLSACVVFAASLPAGGAPEKDHAAEETLEAQEQFYPGGFGGNGGNGGYSGGFNPYKPYNGYGNHGGGYYGGGGHHHHHHGGYGG